MTLTELERRFVDVLAPSDERRDRIERWIAKIADEIDDDVLFDGLVAAAEGRDIGTREFIDRVPGMTERRLRHWVDLGLLEPVEAHPGSGRDLRFSPDQLAVARQMTPFVLEGVNPTVARSLADGILRHGRVDFAGFTIGAS